MLVKKKETTSSPFEIHALTKADQLCWLMEEYGDMLVDSYELTIYGQDKKIINR
jgi:hypothetical protein